MNKGRPKKKNAKQNEYCIRMSDYELDTLEDLAERLGMTKADALRAAVGLAHVIAVDSQERAEKLGDYLYDIRVAPHLGGNVFVISVPFTPGEKITYQYRTPVCYPWKYIKEDEK